MKVNDRVKVSDVFCLFCGCTGTVMAIENNSVTVKADGDYGHFLFNTQDLEVLQDDTD